MIKIDFKKLDTQTRQLLEMLDIDADDLEEMTGLAKNTLQKAGVRSKQVTPKNKELWSDNPLVIGFWSLYF